MDKRLLWVMLGVLLLGSLFWFRADAVVAKETQSTSSQDLSQVLKNQEKMLELLEGIREELDVIRIRVSRQ